MKRLKHLLWIVPLVFVTLVLGLALRTSNALDREIDYHQVLVASIQVRSNDFEDLEEMAVQFSCQGEGISGTGKVRISLPSASCTLGAAPLARPPQGVR